MTKTELIVPFTSKSDPFTVLRAEVCGRAEGIDSFDLFRRDSLYVYSLGVLNAYSSRRDEHV